VSEEEYNQRIERIAEQIIKDGTSLDEQDPKKLKRYYDFVITNFNLHGESMSQIVNEAFLYLKLKSSKDVDPIKEGDQFGAGFS
jgi:hypothetical protein